MEQQQQQDEPAVPGEVQTAPNDPTLIVRVARPLPFERLQPNEIRRTSRITTRVYDPAARTTTLATNVLVPFPGDPECAAYWIQHFKRDSQYGPVSSGMVLRSRAQQGSEPEAEWVVTGRICAVKEMGLVAIRERRHQLGDDPILEVTALKYMTERRRQHGQPGADENEGAEEATGSLLLPLAILTDDRNLYIVSPFCNGGDMLDLMAERGIPRFTEEESRYWMRQMLQALEQLQHEGICHHDISLENLLVHNGRCMFVIDLGMCLRVPFEQNSWRRYLMPPQGRFGKLRYMSPEVYRDLFPFDGFAVDLWAVGVVLHIMLTGYNPWEIPHDSDPNFRRKSGGDMIQSLRDMNLGLSEYAMDLLQQMLHRNPDIRLTLGRVRQHPWMAEGEAVPEGGVHG